MTDRDRDARRPATRGVVLGVLYGIAAAIAAAATVDIADAFRYEPNPQAREAQRWAAVVTALLGAGAVLFLLFGARVPRSRWVIAGFVVLCIAGAVTAGALWFASCFFKC